MGVPKYRTSSASRDRRRSHDALVAPGKSTCKNCGEVRQPHTVCGSCGFYKDKVVVEPKVAKIDEGQEG
jgi:large subunit ribosomal protein L32